MKESNDPPRFESFNCNADLGFTAWVAKSGGAVAVSTYQAGRLLLIGWLGNQLSLLPRQFERPMGVDVKGNRLILATQHDHMLQQQPGTGP